jgi:hypothetical protein
LTNHPAPTIKKHIGQTGKLRAWYQANKDRLRFDPETEIFVAE